MIKQNKILQNLSFSSFLFYICTDIYLIVICPKESTKERTKLGVLLGVSDRLGILSRKNENKWDLHHHMKNIGVTNELTQIKYQRINLKLLLGFWKLSLGWKKNHSKRWAHTQQWRFFIIIYKSLRTFTFTSTSTPFFFLNLTSKFWDLIPILSHKSSLSH